MSIFEAIILAFVQGITEFLPISSSAHLILVPKLLGWADQGLAFDVIVHVGTLTAVIVYFRQDLWQIIRHWVRQFVLNRPADPQGYARLGNLIIVATIPTGLLGLLLNHYVDTYLRSPLIIAVATLVFGLLLGTADYYGRRYKPITRLSIVHALLFGLAQAVAIIPGTSRSGITLTMGLMLGYTRETAARFSFLISIPIILLAGGLKTLELIRSDLPVPVMPMLVGFIVSALAAYACIALFLRFLTRVGMMPYVIYRILLATVLVVVFI
ncbi:MAG: undecaprenyl-diphosphatase [Cardiobacteriales bacterium]|nr:MAG: undecaprenyl-diphosphatase [Cardiobacteriales bacterium]